MAQTEHHKYSICIPSACTSAPHMKKRARNGHQKSKVHQKLVIRRSPIYSYGLYAFIIIESISFLITPDRSFFLLATLLVMLLVGAIYWFSISLATFYQSDNIFTESATSLSVI